MEFTGKHVVVMGGSRGIGRSIALAFAAAGAAVSICARGAGPLAAAQGEIKALGVHAHSATVDLADADAIARYVPEAAAALGGLDVLVNNASGFGANGRRGRVGRVPVRGRDGRRPRQPRRRPADGARAAAS